jgi:hypothetical protein
MDNLIFCTDRSVTSENCASTIDLFGDTNISVKNSEEIKNYFPIPSNTFVIFDLGNKKIRNLFEDDFENNYYAAFDDGGIMPNWVIGTQGILCMHGIF